MTQKIDSDQAVIAALDGKLNAYYPVTVGTDNYSKMLDWALENCEGKFCDFVTDHSFRKWYFQLEKDAVFFSIKWGTTPKR